MADCMLSNGIWSIVAVGSWARVELQMLLLWVCTLESHILLAVLWVWRLVWSLLLHGPPLVAGPD